MANGTHPLVAPARQAVDQPADVTIVVVPRERFGVAEQALASVIAHSTPPYALVYVDGGGPVRLRAHLREQASRHGFRLVSARRYLTPNEARNIGWKLAATEFVVFIDNDVIASPGWLESLVERARASGADAVSPLICQRLPLHSEVHQAGGQFATNAGRFFATAPGERLLDEKLYLQGKPVGVVDPRPVETQLCEFHCLLVRRDLIDRLGPLDEAMMATREHLDFCMGIARAGGTMLFEPTSIVTYLDPWSTPLRLNDWPYFLVRWSERWQRRSIDHFQAKWGLDPHQPCFRDRRGNERFRYTANLVKPTVARLPLAGRSRLVRGAGTRAVGQLSRLVGGLLTRATDRRRHRDAGAAPAR